MKIFPMPELVLLWAAAISIAVTVSAFGKRRFVAEPARAGNRQP